jgi:hypothetical protein
LPPSERARARLLGAIAFSWFAFLGLRHVSAVPATGDEPDYLLIAQSIWRDLDLNTDDNFARGEFEGYAPGLSRAPGLVRRGDGGGASVHSAGLPVLMAPVFALGDAIGGGQVGRTACVLLMALFAALLAEQCRVLAHRVAAEDVALYVWAAILGLPAAGLAISIYPEIPAALAIALALRWITGSASPATAIGAALALSALPWLHARVAGASVVLGGLAVARFKGASRLAFAGVASLMALAYFAFFRVAYGVPTPWDVYRGAMNRGTPGLAAPGLLLDPSYGLLPYAPVFVLALAGVPLLFSRRNPDRLAHVSLALALLAPVLMFRKWWGGFCPPARFLVPLLPYLALALAARLGASVGSHSGIARWRKPLVAASLMIALLPAFSPADRLLLNMRDETPRLWARLDLGSGLIASMLPRVSSRAGSTTPPWRPPDAERRVAILGAALLLAVLVLDAASRRSPRFDRTFTGAVMGLALAFALIVSLGIRRGAPEVPTLPPEEISEPD